jgi:hypothetical protein
MHLNIPWVLQIFISLMLMLCCIRWLGVEW